MPKFFKRDILAQLPSEGPNPALEAPPAPDDYASLAIPPEPPVILQQEKPADPTQPTSETPTAPLQPNMPTFIPAMAQENHHANFDTWHDPVPNTMEHIFSPDEMKPVEHHPTQNNHHQEPELLPSPLDTPELPPAHSITAQPTNPDSALPDHPQPISSSPNTPLDPSAVTPTTEPHPNPSNNATPESKVVETLLIWQAPSRPHRKKDRSFYTTVGILITLIAMIALLAGEKMLVAVLFALMFLVYVINFIEPQEIEYKLSTQGVTVDNHFYHWQELDSFWFDKKDGYTILNILTQLRFPGVLMLVLNPSLEEDTVKKTVVRFLPFHEIAPKSLIDRWAEGLQKYFPLENPHK